MRLLTPSLWPSLRPRAFCAGVELDMYVHVPGRICRREVSLMSPRARNHHLFLHAAGSLCKACVQAWVDRGADTSYGTPWEPHKSALTWAEEAQGDEGLLSMLSAPGGGTVPVRYAMFLLFLGSRGGGSARGRCFLFRLLVVWGR